MTANTSNTKDPGSKLVSGIDVSAFAARTYLLAQPPPWTERVSLVSHVESGAQMDAVPSRSSRHPTHRLDPAKAMKRRGCQTAKTVTIEQTSIICTISAIASKGVQNEFVFRTIHLLLYGRNYVRLLKFAFHGESYLATADKHPADRGC
jgi:hypothetical protein